MTEPMRCATVGGIDSLTEARAQFVYDSARLQAIAVNAPIVPEPYNERDGVFQRQFREVIERQTGEMRSGSPAELHGGWVQAYIDMGWRYGPVRDTEAKTHPDMVPFDKLEKREQDKDAVFIALCEIARLWIQSENSNHKETPPGIKSEDIKPVEGVTVEEIGGTESEFVGKWVQISDAVLRRYRIDQEDDGIVHFCERSRPEGYSPAIDTWWNKSQCTIVDGPFLPPPAPEEPGKFCTCGQFRLGQGKRPGFQRHCFDGSPCNLMPRPPLPTSREWLEYDGVQSFGCGRKHQRGYICTREFHADTDWHVAGLEKNKVSGRWYTDGPFVEAK